VSSRQQHGQIFFVLKARKGRYRACVDLAPGTNGKHRFSRDTATREEAEELLRKLQQALTENQGLVVPIIEAWRDGKEVPDAVALDPVRAGRVPGTTDDSNTGE
jgi:hypothetical protein